MTTSHARRGSRRRELTLLLVVVLLLTGLVSVAVLRLAGAT